MKRRRLMIGFGGLAALVSAVGSGAFSSVRAQRDISVSVAADSNAFLTLRQSSGPNGEFATETGGELGLSFADADGTGRGLGTDSTYEFDDVFQVRNRGTQSVYVWAVPQFDGSAFDPGDVTFYASGAGDTPLRETADVPSVTAGETLAVGVEFDTTGIDTDQTLSVVFRGDVDPPRDTNPGDTGSTSTLRRRVEAEFQTRKAYSREHLLVSSDTSPHASNDRVTDGAVVGKFGKSLPRDAAGGSETGLPATDAYDRLVQATESGGETVGYRQIPQAFEGATGADVPDAVDLADKTDALDSRPLVQPETAWTYLTSGKSTGTLRIAEPPRFDDPEAGAEMVELYWRALTRDVKFRNYDSHGDVQNAAAELDGLDAYAGPGADGTVDTGNVFRGVTPGAATGPYVSQFLLKDRPLGGGVEDQQIEVPPDGRDYATSVREWLKIQRGVAPAVDDSLSGNRLDGRRYILTGRDMAERVHDDPPFRQVQKAAQVLVFGTSTPLDDGVPYTLKPFDKPVAEASSRTVSAFTGQTTLPFNDFGPLYVEKRVLEASEIGQKAAWHKKWNVHRRLRPEEYGGRVEATRDESSLDTPTDVDLSARVPDNLLDSEALSETQSRFDTYLLPQAYAEGSPVHPSYPAGHSVVAGAGVTVLKALFDGDYVLPADEKVVPTKDGSDLVTAADLQTKTTELPADEQDVDAELTVRGELNKLASNMALGRNRAGIHYRTDGIEGLRLGERAAISYLEDQLSLPRRLPEYDSLELTLETFDGKTKRITPTTE
jgi:hypothetical protein